MLYKKITEITLRSGEKIHVTLAEGNSTKTAKASAQSKSVIFPSLKNRLIDTSFIVDIQDKSVEDPEATKAQQLKETQQNLIAAGLIEPKVDVRHRPGYIKYIVSAIKLRRKARLSENDIKAKLDEKQVELVKEELARQSLEW